MTLFITFTTSCINEYLSIGGDENLSKLSSHVINCCMARMSQRSRVGVGMNRSAMGGKV